MKKLLIAIVACLFLAGMTATANAVVLLPGDSGIACTNAVSPGGSIVTSVSYNFTSVGDVFHGTLTETVRSNVNGYLFEYLISNDSTSGTPISSISTGDFGGFTTNVGADNAPLNPFPSTLQRSLNGTGIVFNYDTSTDPIHPGDTADLLWIQTNSNTYGDGFTSLLDEDGHSSQVATFDPQNRSRVPEPASAMLLGLGLIGLVGSIRKKFMA